MAEAEGKIFSFLDETEIQTEYLETFEFGSLNQLIITTTDEFSAVCPFSGLPDVATVKIEYYPLGGKCIELKSLKYYMTSFRNVGLYQEGVTKRMYDDLGEILNTHRLRVTSHYNRRGGFDTTCVEGGL